MSGAGPAGGSPAGAGPGGSTVPTVATITPSIVHTGGGTVVEVVGTNFKVPVIPPPSGGPTPALVPTVAVEFDGLSALKVSVISATRMLVQVPASPIAVTKANDYGEGTVDVVVKNLDAAGDPIPGELVTVADGLDYRRPQLANASVVTRMVRALIRQFRLQVITNVSTTNHTDFDADTGDLLNVTELAAPPGIALIGPDLSENRFYSLNFPPQLEESGSGEFIQRRVPYTVDMAFTLVAVTNLQKELLNLMGLVQQFFERNKFIELDRDPTDPSKGKVAYELEITEEGDMGVFGNPNNSNIRSFSGTFLVRGVDLEDIPGFDGSQVIDKTFPTDAVGVRLSTEQIGESFGVGPSPGDC
jgi:hypothetical protein